MPSQQKQKYQNIRGLKLKPPNHNNPKKKRKNRSKKKQRRLLISTSFWKYSKQVMMVHLMEHSSIGTYNKLKSKKISPCQIVKKINDYVVDFSDSYFANI